MAIQKTGTKPIQRPDAAILEDIWQALRNEETIWTIDSQAMAVDVECGQVCLSGHVSRDNNNQRIKEIAWSIAGVTAVHNHLVSDHDLTIQVAQALGEDERTRPFVLPVFCSHGWVELVGTVPNQAIQRAAEAAAASVPAVRGVILLPDIPGQPADSGRDAVQPGIGVRVYAAEETEGTVYQVVINPQNRLVTHTIVRVAGQHTGDGRQVWGEYLLPVEAMQVVDAGGIYLRRGAGAIPAFPVFNPAHYPFAPLTWQPPYPYAVGSIRWPRQEPGKDKQTRTPPAVKGQLDNVIYLL